eukprot:scaffold50610_cov21-Tisochrysis_lutea.AAC.1
MVQAAHINDGQNPKMSTQLAQRERQTLRSWFAAPAAAAVVLSDSAGVLHPLTPPFQPSKEG